MSEFVQGENVKARKIHRCFTCGGTIPKGAKCHHVHGKEEGEFFGYYLCDRCHMLSDNLTTQDIVVDDCYMRTNFYEGLSDNGYLSCPNCKNDYVDDSEFSDDCLSIKCTCFGCGKEYTVDLTYDAIVKKAEQMAEEVRARREQMLKGVTT